VDIGVPGIEERMLAYNTGFEAPPKKEVVAPAAPEAAAPTPEPEPAAEPAPAPTEAAPTEEAEPESEATAPPLYTVIVDGHEAQVPVDELVAGYQRQADYTRKTTEVARQRETIEADSRRLRETLDKEAQVLTAAEQWLQTQLPADPDWSKLAGEVSDAEFNRQYALHAQQKEKLAAVQTKLASIREQQQKDQTEQFRTFILQQEQKLLERVPEWKDTAKAKAEMGSLTAWIKERFPETTDAEIAQTVDHRWWALARDAKAYRDALGKPKVTRPQATSPVVAPGAKGLPPKKPDAIAEARSRVKETGAIEDATEAVFRMLNEGRI
jgi:hypothetical protein